MLNMADVEQHRVLEVEVNELRRRRDNARDANRRTEQRLALLLEQTERLQHHLSTPEGTPYPVHTARSRGDGKTPDARLEEGLRSLSASMRAGPAGAAMRRPGSAASSRPGSASGASLADLATTAFFERSEGWALPLRYSPLDPVFSNGVSAPCLSKRLKM